MDFFPNMNNIPNGMMGGNMVPIINNGMDYMNNIFNKFNEFESRIKKLEQRVEKLEGVGNYKKNNYMEPNNSLYMI